MQLRRFGLIPLVAAISAISASSAPAREGPVLRIRSLAPLTVVGRGFAAQERVAITVRRAAKRVARRRVLATRDGALRARFSLLLVTDTCRGSLVVVASGAAGSRASVSRPCRPPDPQAP
jgi:hypothetical protein